MKKILLSLLVLCTALASHAQDGRNIKISGKVTDSVSGSPIEYATITLHAQDSKKELTGTTTDISGHFTIEGITEGDYVLLVESIGYQPYHMAHVIITKKGIQPALENIPLIKSGKILQNVVVTASKGLIENKIDKMVFNAEKDLTSQGGVATDILKKVPQVSVDADGNVQLAGASGIRFLINGKPSAAFGSNIADVLQSIPASQVKSIEVVTNPGAKYDAQGMAGIINIILKQNKVKGINGNLSLTAGTRAENGSLNINARKNDFGLNAFISGNTRLKATTPNVSERLATDSFTRTVLNQQGYNRFSRNGYQAGIGFDWTLRKRNSFSGSLGYNHFGNKGAGENNQQLLQQALGGGPVLSQSSVVNRSQNAFRFHNIDAGLGYKRTFRQEDHELELSFNTSAGNSHSHLFNNRFELPADTIIYGTSSTNPARESETEFKLDYTRPLAKEVLLGMGGKINLVNISSTSNVLSYDAGSHAYGYDAGLSNNLRYRQKVYALYSEINFPAGKIMDVKMGLRYERTEIGSYFSKAQQQSQAPGYNTLVPSVFLSRKLGEDQVLKLSYSKRIERPDYEDLNPFINTIDPSNLSAGNPYLLPEIGHRFELGYSHNFKKGGSMMATLFYRINGDDIQPYIVFYPSLRVGDSTYTNVSLNTKQNIGSERNGGLNLFGDVKLGSKLGLRTNISLFHRHTINALDQGANSNSFNYRINLNASFLFSQTLAGEFFGNFNSPRNEVQGRYPSFTTYSVALRKQFWNKKGSLALSGTNFFSKYVDQRTLLKGSNFTVNSLRQIPYRAVSINFTWKFGKLEFKKEKEENNGNLNAPVE